MTNRPTHLILTIIRASSWLNRLFAAVWLLLLSIYVLAGLPIVTFHGDESMQIYMSHDYATAFIYGEPGRLVTEPPYFIDSDGQLRLINGSVNRHAIGLSWHLAGFTNGDLPPAPGWDWGLTYDENVATDHRPPPPLLAAARASSTVFLALSVVVMFMLGSLLGGRVVAYVASGLYAVNPVVLLNGRRAMQEGALLFFGLLSVLAASLLTRALVRRKARWYHWVALGVAGALALTSKHSSAVFVAGAFGWVLVALVVQRRDWRSLLGQLARLTGAGTVTVGLFVALSPALWHDPLARFGDVLQARSELLAIQVSIDPAAPTDLGERIRAIITQPFLTPPEHFEHYSWLNATGYDGEIARYLASPLSGVQFGVWLGNALTLLAGWGLVVTVFSLRQRGALQTPKTHPSQIYGLLVLLAVIVASLLVNPLPWQRYYLSLIPVVTLLAALGVGWLVHYFVRER